MQGVATNCIAHLIPSHGHWSVVSGECVLQVRAFVPTLNPRAVHRCSLKVSLVHRCMFPETESEERLPAMGKKEAS